MANKNKTVPYSIIQEFLGDLRKWDREHDDYTANDAIRDLSVTLADYISDYQPKQEN